MVFCSKDSANCHSNGRRGKGQKAERSDDKVAENTREQVEDHPGGIFGGGVQQIDVSMVGSPGGDVGQDCALPEPLSKQNRAATMDRELKQTYVRGGQRVGGDPAKLEPGKIGLVGAGATIGGEGGQGSLTSCRAPLGRPSSSDLAAIPLLATESTSRIQYPRPWAPSRAPPELNSCARGPEWPRSGDARVGEAERNSPSRFEITTVLEFGHPRHAFARHQLLFCGFLSDPHPDQAEMIVCVSDAAPILGKEAMVSLWRVKSSLHCCEFIDSRRLSRRNRFSKRGVSKQSRLCLQLQVLALTTGRPANLFREPWPAAVEHLG